MKYYKRLTNKHTNNVTYIIYMYMKTHTTSNSLFYGAEDYHMHDVM